MDALAGWHDFFLLSGGASATLMGLVFVAVSLTPALGDSALDVARERSLFVTPIVFQLGYALAISAIDVAPWSNPTTFGALTAAIGAIACVQCLALLRGLFVRHRIDRVGAKWWLLDVVFPLCAAALWTASGVIALVRGAPILELVALATLGLALLGVANSYRLIIWMIGHRKH